MWGYSYYPTSNELYHHGILGQKWGKRNGPPYPLGASDHSASEKKAGWRKSLEGDNRLDKIPVHKLGSIKQLKKLISRKCSIYVKGNSDASTHLVVDHLGESNPVYKDNLTVINDLKNRGKNLDETMANLMDSCDETLEMISSDDSFIDSINKKMREDFGDGVDDPEYYYMVKEEYIFDAFYESGLSRKFVDNCRETEKKYDEYFELIKKTADSIAGDNKNEILYRSNGASINYGTFVYMTLFNNAASAPASMYSNMYDYINEKILMKADSIGLSFEEYNEKYGTRKEE